MICEHRGTSAPSILFCIKKNNRISAHKSNILCLSHSKLPQKMEMTVQRFWNMIKRLCPQKSKHQSSCQRDDVQVDCNLSEECGPALCKQTLLDWRRLAHVTRDHQKTFLASAWAPPPCSESTEQRGTGKTRGSDHMKEDCDRKRG